MGIIQWAQRPGRLAEIVAAFQACDSAQFAQVFGAGDAALAERLIDHLRSSGGGVDPTGCTTDPEFDLIQEPWIGRFRQAAVVQVFQKAQVETALAAFARSREALERNVPEAVTERGVAFFLDVANQFGDGGLAQLAQAARRSGQSEQDLMEAVADETVARMPDNFKMGVRARRDTFLHSPLFSDKPFAEALAQGQ